MPFKLIHQFKAVPDEAEGNIDLIQQIHKLFHNNVHDHVDLYLYFKKMTFRHLEVSHSSYHESNRHLYNALNMIRQNKSNTNNEVN